MPISDHDSVLGVGFNAKFAKEMKDYYSPFVKKKREIILGKETWEYAVTDSIPGAVHMGSGNSMVDVATPTANVDVKGLSIGSLDKGLTTEASFLQNLQKGSDNVNTLFESQDFSKLKDMFVDGWLKKAVVAGNVYLFIVVREKKTKKVYYCLFKTEHSSLTDAEFISKMSLRGGRGVHVPLMDDEFGSTYICISKRRLELRLNCVGLKDYLVESHTV